MKKAVISLILFYQKTFSPDKGWFKLKYPNGYCKYTPHCSQYCLEAVEKYGVVKGLGLGFWRVIRCNPWSKGGYDPVK